MRQFGWKIILLGSVIALAREPAALWARPEQTMPSTNVFSPPEASLSPALQSLLPGEYSILDVRSIFLRGQLTDGSGWPKVPPGPGGADPLPETPKPRVPAPEESLVFDGVTKADEQIIGFVEDRNNLTMSLVKVGDLIARGKVTAITLDGMNYSANGKVVHVQLGENLLGNRPSIADMSGR